ncbi:hypothetical protein HYQ44_004386 [Verticillium longisporum]|nr:hypothetical protein HYQ44_004386 [Verticillium longisporum]
MMPSGWQTAPPGLQRPTPVPPISNYAYPPNPAYTPVQVRQGFGQYPPHPMPHAPVAMPSSETVTPAPAAPPPKGKVVFSPSVREYVRRAFLPANLNPYKPDVKLRFITEELGFESDHDAAQFIVDYNGQDLLEERQDSISLMTGKAGPLFETARSAAFRTVDIKGQI